MARYDDLRRLFASVYDNNLEIDTIARAEADLFDELDVNFNDFGDNQYIATANLSGIEEYERMYGIVADTITESLEFRRARIIARLSAVPPYTMIFFRNRLDSIIGEGNYETYVDYNNHILFVNAVTADQAWYHELFVFVNQVKPASLIFSFSPRDEMEFRFNELISHAQRTYHYKLNGSWGIGLQSFASLGPMEVNKLPNIPSITDKFLQDHAQYSADSITQSLINNSLLITDITKTVSTEEPFETMISYTIPLDSGITEINNIKLQDSTGNNLTDIDVYVPVPDEVVLEHVIRHIEGIQED